MQLTMKRLNSRFPWFTMKITTMGALVSTRCYHGHMVPYYTEQEWLERLILHTDEYEGFSEWNDQSAKDYETPPRSLGANDRWCKRCRKVHTLPEKEIARIEARKEAGKVMTLTCACGNKMYL